MRCRLVAYYRVSTAQQGRSGLGLEAQEAAVAAHVALTGCDLVAKYVEVESGRKSARPELLRAIAHAKRAKATLVIAKLDRLSRNVAFIANLMESGVEFVACDNPQANRLTVHILAAVAEQETRSISERTKAALAAAKARGTKLGTDNLTKFGTVASLRGAERAAQAHQSAKIAAYADLLPALEALREGGQSYAAIAKRLNSEGQRTRRDAEWNAAQVRRVLQPREDAEWNAAQSQRVMDLRALRDEKWKKVRAARVGTPEHAAASDAYLLANGAVNEALTELNEARKAKDARAHHFFRARASGT